MKYRKKPVVIEAFKYGVDGQPDWFIDKVITNDITTYADDESNDPFERSSGLWCEIKTLEGTMVAKEGDYVIRGIEGEIYPCKPSVFEETYEKVEEPKKKV